MTPARLEHDMAVCRKDALSRSSLAVLSADRIDRRVFNLCMERKGYQARVEK